MLQAVRRRLFAGAPFSVRALFRALQGAWYEPLLGSMWQENTGVTPVTASAQTVGKLADLSGYGNNAAQATASLRPTYQLDSNLLPLIRSDTNDVLTASLPALSGGIFSAAGSVYFATPQGMSALHNQSMGTSYNLPALSSDIYAWCVFPQRLSSVEEARLDAYMRRKAGLVAADAFEQVSYGPELVTNGSFSSGTTGWTTYNSATVSTVGGAIRVTNGASLWGSASIPFTTIVGRTYSLSQNNWLRTAYKTEISIGTTGAGYSVLDVNNPVSGSSYLFTATSTTSYVTIWAGSNVSGQYSDFDNISVREFIDGMDGALLMDDGSEILLRG